MFSLNALELVDACDRYAKDGALVAKKAEMEGRARVEVQRFRNQCKVDGPTPSPEEAATTGTPTMAKGQKSSAPLHFRKMWRCGSVRKIVTP